MSYSDSQLVALAIVPKITSSVSIPCQVWIIRQVISDHRHKRGKATSRALLGMGCIDIAASFGWFLSTWAAPKGTPDTPFAAGTTQSCTFQGFLLQLAIGAPFYNCLLALLYLLTVRYGWREERLRKVEYICHAAILLFAIGTGLALIPLGMYNHIGSVCWVIGLPQGCGSSNYGSSSEASVPCERGDHAWIYGVSLFYGPLWVCIAFTTAAMMTIYRKVKATESRSNRYSGGSPTRSRANDVKMQALLYCCAFYLSWLPSTLWSITQWRGQPMFWLDLLATICEPSQGWLNLLVFIRPRKALQQQLKWDILTLVTCGLCRGPSDDGADDDALDSTSNRTASGGRGNGVHETIRPLTEAFFFDEHEFCNVLPEQSGSNGDISLPSASDATAKESSAEQQTQKVRRISSLVDVAESGSEDEGAEMGREEGAQEDDWRDDKA